MKTLNIGSGKYKDNNGEWSTLPCLKGDKGEHGVQGIQGIKGNVGEKGDKGDTGESAYQLAVRLGTFTGTEEEYNKQITDAVDKADTATKLVKKVEDQIQKNTEDIAGLEETVSTAGISVTEAGTEIVVPECTGGKLQGLKMYGKSEQVQYSGKNLFNVSDTTNNILTKNGIKINEVDQQNGIIKAKFSQPYQQLGVMINSSANTTYTLSFKQKNSKNNEIEVRSYYVKNDVMGDNIKQVVISSEEASFTFTVLNDSYIVVFFRPKGNYSSSDTNVCEFTNIQLERNASSTDFEPYVGGKPSPSPDYPQSIDVLGEENITTTIKTSIANYKNAYLKEGMYPEWCENGFIFDASASSRFVYIPVELKKGKSYIVEYKTENISGSQEIGIYLPDNLQFLKVSTVFKPKTDVEKIALYMPEDKIPAKNKILKFKVYEQSQEPRKINISSPNGLPGIQVSSGGNYTDSSGQKWICDEIDFQRGVYIQRVGIKVGIDGFQETNSANSDMSLRIVCNTNDIEKVKFTPIICNKLRWEKKSSYTEEGTYISTSEAAIGRVCVRVEGIKTMEEYQEILADMQYFYILATPIETPLTTEEINAYKSLYTYDGTTIIDNDAGCYMEATVPQDTKYYIDNKIAELSAAIVASASEAE